jgi:hypothetical protein
MPVFVTVKYMFIAHCCCSPKKSAKHIYTCILYKLQKKKVKENPAGSKNTAPEFVAAQNQPALKWVLYKSVKGNSSGNLYCNPGVAC